jgi:hypothetical protein
MNLNENISFSCTNEMLVQLVRQESELIPLSAEIKYYEIRYCCISGGAAFKAREHGIKETS